MKTLPKVLIAIFTCAFLLIVFAFVTIIKSAEKEAVYQPQEEMVEEEVESVRAAARRMRR